MAVPWYLIYIKENYSVLVTFLISVCDPYLFSYLCDHLLNDMYMHSAALFLHCFGSSLIENK